MAYSKLLGYAPDADPTLRGVIKDAENIVPTPKGIAGAPSPNNTTVTALSATCVGAVTIEQLNGTKRTFAGTTTKLYELAGNAWTDRSRGGGAYTAGSTWNFTQYEDMTIATNDVAVIQFSSSGAFADLTSAPRASIVEVANNQVFAFDTNDATYGDDSNRWWAAAQGNPGSWTASIATQAVSGTLTETEGGITAARPHGQDMIAFKAGSTYLGRYFGPPVIWGFVPIADEIGSVSHKGTVVVGRDGAMIFFMGRDDFYVYNGSVPVSVGQDIRDFFFDSEIDKDNFDKVEAAVDRDNKLIYWFYPSAEAGTGKLDRFVVYDYQRKRWGIGPRGVHATALSIEAVLEYIRATGPTYGTLGNAYATYADLPAIPYNSSFWISSVRRVGIFNDSHVLQTMDGPALISSIILWDIGDDNKYSWMSRARPRFNKAPSSAVQVNSYRDHTGEDFVSSSATSSLSGGKFDFERSARWHSLRQTYSGDVELIGVDISVEEDGFE